MPRKEMFIGIDVAKDVLDVSVRPTGEALHVTNDEVGIAELVQRLQALRPTLIVLEATGRLHVAAVGAPSFLGRRGRRPYILAPWSTCRVVPFGTRRTQ